MGAMSLRIRGVGSPAEPLRGEALRGTFVIARGLPTYHLPETFKLSLKLLGR